MRREIEGVLFGLFRGRSDESATIESLSDDRRQVSASRLHFFPQGHGPIYADPANRIRPRLRCARHRLRHLRQCSWENYATYNQTFAALRPLIEVSTGLKTVRLIDAHSFCWIFSTLLKLARKV